MPSKRQANSSQTASSRQSSSNPKAPTPSSASPASTTTGTTNSAVTPRGSASNVSSKSPTSSTSLKSSAAALKSSTSPQEILATLWDNYVSSTPQRVKLIDAFMGFLVVVGALQFLYCVLVGNYPFNAFLSGFSATVGQFVLTASLRIQTNPANKSEFASVSPERAFADFVFGSLILHFFCVNFIN